MSFDCLGLVGQSVIWARRRRAIVDPGCSVRVGDVCAYSRIPVCGTAHTLSTPNWMATRGLSGVINARQVSSRGGDLIIQFDEAEESIKLAGKVRTMSQGELYV